MSESNGKALLEVENLVKTYIMGEVKVRALRGVSITVERGDFVAIMGPSGSGKSTFMNILGCLDTPSSGIYLLDNIDVSKMTKDELAGIRNLKIGFVFQGFNLLARTTAIENVELPMLYSEKFDSLEREKRAAKALESVGLGKRTHHVPSQMSGGEQQRVAIARSLVNDPPLILADEPTGNLDTKTSIEIMNIFQKLNDEKGITILMVTHEPDISSYAKRIISLRDGKLLSDEKVVNRSIAEKILSDGKLSENGEFIED
ncbi:MAG: ABC transporter ATP-binding protein [Firmicutes bacterium]|nr:ABC transporter ATP-binding protein [Bacillota bacterium]